MWGDDRPPVMLVDAETREEVRPIVVHEHTGEPFDVRRLRMKLRK